MKRDLKNLRRVQLDMPPKAYERLKRLKEKTEATSYSDVIKTALKLLEVVLDETESGNTLLIKDKDGNVYPFKVFVGY